MDSKHLIAIALMGGLLTLTPTSQASISYTYTTINAPSGGYDATITGISDRGEVAGNYIIDNNTGNGFTESGFKESNGVYTTYGSIVIGISSGGVVYGGYMDGVNNSNTSGFTESNGVYTTIIDPNAINNGHAPAFTLNTTVTGVTDSGVVFGYYHDFRGVQHTFSESNGVYTDGYTISPYPTISDPNGHITQATGVSSSGVLIGNYLNGGVQYGFTESNGVYSTISDPNGISTQITGITSSGVVAGTYTNTYGTYGFIATPSIVPVPTAVWLFASGFGLLSFIGRKKTQRLT